MGDDLMSPFLSAGWSQQAERNIRPAQWLGLLKVLAMWGAEWFYVGFFSLRQPFQDSANWCWQALMPIYAQALIVTQAASFTGAAMEQGRCEGEEAMETLEKLVEEARRGGARARGRAAALLAWLSMSPKCSALKLLPSATIFGALRRAARRLETTEARRLAPSLPTPLWETSNERTPLSLSPWTSAKTPRSPMLFRFKARWISVPFAASASPRPAGSGKV